MSSSDPGEREGSKNYISFLSLSAQRACPPKGARAAQRRARGSTPGRRSVRARPKERGRRSDVPVEVREGGAARVSAQRSAGGRSDVPMEVVGVRK